MTTTAAVAASASKVAAKRVSTSASKVSAAGRCASNGMPAASKRSVGEVRRGMTLPRSERPWSDRMWGSAWSQPTVRSC